MSLTNSRKLPAALRDLLVLPLAAVVLFAAYAAYRWLDSAPGDDLAALARQAEKYMGAEELRVERTARRGDYLAALCVDGSGTYRLCVYDRDRLWSSRWHANGGKSALRAGKLDSWNYGSPAGEAVLIICGYGLDADVQGYSFQNAGVTYTCPVEGDEVLDVFVIPDGRDDINGFPVPLRAAELCEN